MAKKEKYYLGNERLPTSGTEFEWTPEMMRDLKKCRKDIIYFAENFFYIVNLDKGKMKIPLYKYQKRILRSLRDNRYVITTASRQCGKCFLDDTMLTVRNKKTGEVMKISAGNFYNRFI